MSSTASDEKRKSPSPYLHFFAGWFGGSIACTILSPLEVIKTRQQSSTAIGSNLRADRLALHIFRTEGFRGFFRGLVPHLLGVGPSRAFYFSGYSMTKDFLNKDNKNSKSFIRLSGIPLHLVSAAWASIVSATTMSPVWVVKTRLQLQTVPASAPSMLSASGDAAQTHYKGVVDTFVRIYREEGIRAFYRGLGAAYLGIIETSIQYALYGYLKDKVIDKKIDDLNRKTGANYSKSDESLRKEVYGTRATFATSAISKLLAALLTYPHEVLRTRMRENTVTKLYNSSGQVISVIPRYHGILQSFALILREEGARGLYGGMMVHMLRTVPNAAILLTVVEAIVGGAV